MTSKTSFSLPGLPTKKIPVKKATSAHSAVKETALPHIRRPSAPIPSKKREIVKKSSAPRDEELSPESHLRNFQSVAAAMLTLIKKNAEGNR